MLAYIQIVFINNVISKCLHLNSSKIYVKCCCYQLCVSTVNPGLVEVQCEP